ncbi:M15 family metallopeptidase [Streptomyces sp. NBC_01217]|uniref:M15 family metallopeptidase n=1 Tax=Streptomyces sp. NBC_01217 TaxID=2903779 RepID=UPI002E0F5BBE|nr:M15 family metallopeptidase [Streptomyces sp. NBC_01217]
MPEIVLMSDPKIAAIPARDCDEPLFDVRRHDPFPVDTREQDDSGAFAHLREGVLSRLIDARKLLPDGIRLLFVEGYRPPALQRFYFERYAERLRNDNPGWSSEQVRAAASRFVSPPEIAPHSAGAAVDLTLVTADDKELDMGTPMDASPEVSKGACYTAACNIGSEARRNRQILTEALTGVGLVNYPTEWWHWSYGDRYWALATGADNAIYGPRELG